MAVPIVPFESNSQRISDSTRLDCLAFPLPKPAWAASDTPVFCLGMKQISDPNSSDTTPYLALQSSQRNPHSGRTSLKTPPTAALSLQISSQKHPAWGCIKAIALLLSGRFRPSFPEQVCFVRGIECTTLPLPSIPLETPFALRTVNSVPASRFSRTSYLSSMCAGLASASWMSDSLTLCMAELSLSFRPAFACSLTKSSRNAYQTTPFLRRDGTSEFWSSRDLMPAMSQRDGLVTALRPDSLSQVLPRFGLAVEASPACRQDIQPGMVPTEVAILYVPGTTNLQRTGTSVDSIQRTVLLLDMSDVHTHSLISCHGIGRHSTLTRLAVDIPLPSRNSERCCHSEQVVLRATWSTIRITSWSCLEFSARKSHEREAFRLIAGSSFAWIWGNRVHGWIKRTTQVQHADSVIASITPSVAISTPAPKLSGPQFYCSLWATSADELWDAAFSLLRNEGLQPGLQPTFARFIKNDSRFALHHIPLLLWTRISAFRFIPNHAIVQLRLFLVSISPIELPVLLRQFWCQVGCGHAIRNYPADQGDAHSATSPTELAIPRVSGNVNLRGPVARICSDWETPPPMEQDEKRLVPSTSGRSAKWDLTLNSPDFGIPLTRRSAGWRGRTGQHIPESTCQSLFSAAWLSQNSMAWEHYRCTSFWYSAGNRLSTSAATRAPGSIEGSEQPPFSFLSTVYFEQRTVLNSLVLALAAGQVRRSILPDLTSILWKRSGSVLRQADQITPLPANIALTLRRTSTSSLGVMLLLPAVVDSTFSLISYFKTVPRQQRPIPVSIFDPVVVSGICCWQNVHVRGIEAHSVCREGAQFVDSPAGDAPLCCLNLSLRSLELTLIATGFEYGDDHQGVMDRPTSGIYPEAPNLRSLLDLAADAHRPTCSSTVSPWFDVAHSQPASQSCQRLNCLIARNSQRIHSNFPEPGSGLTGASRLRSASAKFKLGHPRIMSRAALPSSWGERVTGIPRPTRLETGTDSTSSEPQSGAAGPHSNRGHVRNFDLLQLAGHVNLQAELILSDGVSNSNTSANPGRMILNFGLPGLGSDTRLATGSAFQRLIQAEASGSGSGNSRGYRLVPEGQSRVNSMQILRHVMASGKPVSAHSRDNSNLFTPVVAQIADSLAWHKWRSSVLTSVTTWPVSWADPVPLTQRSPALSAANRRPAALDFSMKGGLL